MSIDSKTHEVAGRLPRYFNQWTPATKLSNHTATHS